MSLGLLPRSNVPGIRILAQCATSRPLEGKHSWNFPPAMCGGSPSAVPPSAKVPSLPDLLSPCQRISSPLAPLRSPLNQIELIFEPRPLADGCTKSHRCISSRTLPQRFLPLNPHARYAAGQQIVSAPLATGHWPPGKMRKCRNLSQKFREHFPRLMLQSPHLN